MQIVTFHCVKVLTAAREVGTGTAAAQRGNQGSLALLCVNVLHLSHPSSLPLCVGPARGRWEIIVK